MKVKKIFLILLFILIILLPMNANAAGNWYYGSGNYVSSAPTKPISGLRFYADYYAISTYGSVYTVAFDWNGSYKCNVNAVAQYPASQSSYPDYFLINTSSTLAPSTRGETFYYSSTGNPINITYPMDSSLIYKCSISLNSDSSVFYVDGSFNSTYLKKVIRHEVGHVFLLKHPSSVNYPLSIMHQGVPNGSVSSTVSSDDRNNIMAKWGQ